MAVGGGGEVQDRIIWNGDSTEDVKIVDSVVEDGKGLGDFAEFSYDKATGDLIIPPSFAFDGYANGELGLRQHLLFGFKCDADYGTEGDYNYGPTFHQLKFYKHISKVFIKRKSLTLISPISTLFPVY